MKNSQQEYPVSVSWRSGWSVSEEPNCRQAFAGNLGTIAGNVGKLIRKVITLQDFREWIQFGKMYEKRKKQEKSEDKFKIRENLFRLVPSFG